MTKPNELTIVEAARALRARELTVRELWDACVTEAKKRNPELNAYLEIFNTDESAIQNAQERIDKEGETVPLLCGIPLAIKDNILIEGHIASAASKMLANYIAPYDATVITKLKEQGALFVGRTNMDEFAMGSSTEHSAFGPTKNPLDSTRVPGGSSGGSAAAVAAHTCLAALGSDTGGSIRQPASYCGLVGLKPTYGAVSRYGLIALGSSLDQIGPLTKTVEDARILYEAMKGHDPMDSQSIGGGESRRENSLADPAYNGGGDPRTFSQATFPGALRVGVPSNLVEKVAGKTAEVFKETLARLQKAGHEIVEVSLPSSEYALAAYYVVMPAEVSTNLARLDGIRYGLAKRGDTLLSDYVLSRTEGFGPETRRRILLGTFVLSSGYIDAYYRKAQASRELLRGEYKKAFNVCDVIAFPTTLSEAFKFGARPDPVAMYLEDIFTVTANLTGLPAISVPAGTIDTLPVGIHFTAPAGGEERLFSIASAV